jgi:dUTP pyrophosphatase
MLATGDQRATKPDKDHISRETFDDWYNATIEDSSTNCDPGQHYHVDFGFMKGSGYCNKDEEGRTITSIDGFRSYFLIIDRKTRYIWLFLTKTKKPPLSIFAQFLKQHGHPTASNRTVRSDRGGELWGSQAFCDTVQQAGYVMAPTAPNAAFQNAKAERPNRNLAKTVRCLLYNANLGPEYWSYALLHAVYLKNRLPHCATNQVPLTSYTGKRPNAKRLRVFGCPVVVRHSDRRAKLDLNTSAGIFLGYTATDKNIVYRDSVTGRFKTATHVIFDEAGMTLPAADCSPTAKALQELGYGTAQEETEEIHSEPETTDVHTPISRPSTDPINTNVAHLKVKCLSINATIPTRATDGSVGYDVFSAVDTILQPKTRKAVPLDIAIEPPVGTYAQLKSRSGMSLKHSIDVQAGTIDRDFTGNIQVVLYNSSDSAYEIKIGDRIAQMVLLMIQTPDIMQTKDLANTSQGKQGFGSTGVNTLDRTTNISNHDETVPIIANLNNMEHKMDINAPSKSVNLKIPNVEQPFDIYFCTDPFDSTVEIDVPIKGDHPTLGIITEYCDARQRLQVMDMALSTPGSRLKGWRTVL